MRIINNSGDYSQCFRRLHKVVLLSKHILMDLVTTHEVREVREAVYYCPAVSIIMRFEPKMDVKSVLSHSIKTAIAKVEQQLSDKYSYEMGRLVMQKLNAIIKRLNYGTHKKSIAIYVSPVFEKILYLDMAFDDKVMVEESFGIRDLIFNKRQLNKYLLLALSDKQSQVYVGDPDGLTKIISNTAAAVSSYVMDVPERLVDLSEDATDEREIGKFFHYIDNSLNTILKAYPYPLFVLGSEKVLSYFEKLTHHPNVAYVQLDSEEPTAQELKETLTPYITDWEKIIEKNLLSQLEEAASRKKLISGIADIWREAISHKCRLLLVEKNYTYPAPHGTIDEVIYKAIEPYNKFSYIKDAVDDVVEKVLEDGGDVEFVNKDVLKDYNRIALIQHY